MTIITNNCALIHLDRAAGYFSHYLTLIAADPQAGREVLCAYLFEVMDAETLLRHAIITGLEYLDHLDEDEASS